MSSKFTRYIAVSLALVALLPVGAVAGAVGAGDFDFFVDTAGFLGANGTRQDFYVRIPNGQLRFTEGDGDRLHGLALVTLRITAQDGREVVREDVKLAMYADSEDEATSPLMFQTLIKSYDLEPGTYRLSCAVQDLNAPKISIVGMVKNEHHHSVVDNFAFAVPEFGGEALSFSDPEFVWSAERRSGGTFYHPNPSRTYGAYLDSLRVYLEAYVPKDLTPVDEPLRFEAMIVDEAGEPVQRSMMTVAAHESEVERQTPAGTVYVHPILIREDLNRFLAGEYSLYLNGGVGDDLLVRMRAGAFTVAWDIRSWESTRRHLMAEARFLLEPEDYDAFVNKSLGEKERILQKMWKELDPDPTTGVNEAYEEFLTRLAYVNVHYSDYQQGFMTDRGLIYLQYGPPDDTIVDVMPLNRDSMSDAFEKVQDRFHAVNFSNTGARVGYATPQRNIIVDPRRFGAVGEGGNVAYPYELWVYLDAGDPIRERDRSLEQDIGLRFIFVDRDGYGRYKLEASSSMANK